MWGAGEGAEGADTSGPLPGSPVEPERRHGEPRQAGVEHSPSTNGEYRLTLELELRDDCAQSFLSNAA